MKFNQDVFSSLASRILKQEKKRTTAKRRMKLQFEKLEPRNLLAATIDNPITTDEVTINLFSLEPTGEARGEVFHDWNKDGQRGRYDTQLSNWFVYADANNNGQHNAGESFTKTDKNGTFILQDVSSPNMVRTIAEGVDFNVSRQLRVNATTHRAQAYPAVATVDVGTVIVWASKRQDGHHWGVYGQRYDSAGARVGSEFLVNTTTASAQTNPSVAAWDNGQFVVTWQSHTPDQGWNIYSQLFSAKGNKLGQERLINRVTSGHQQHPVVKTLTNGNYVVAWQGNGRLNSTQTGPGVFARIFNNKSQMVTSEIAVSRFNFGGPQQYDIAALPNGHFAVAHTYNGIPDSRGIYLHTFNAIGKQTNHKYLVNQFERRGIQRQPALAADSQGNMVVTWTSDRGDGSRTAVMAQQVNADLTFPRYPVVVTQETRGLQWKSDVVMLEGLGGFAVSWQGNGDNDNDGVFIREFNQQSRPVGAEMRLSNSHKGLQRYAAMDISNNGIAVTWHGLSQSDSFGIFTRFIAPDLGNTGTSSISGTVFDDANGNGIRDGGLVLGDEPTVIYIIDESGSTSGPFEGGAVGDLNGDNDPDDIIDGEIAGFEALTQQLIDQGLANDSQISIISFDSSGTLRTSTPLTPTQDDDNNGQRDVSDILRALNPGGGTDYESPLQLAIDVLNDLGISPENGNVIFLSDGEPGSSTNYVDEVATLRGLANNVRAFGAGTGATLDTLQIIDPMAQIFTTTDDLLSVFGGIGNGGGGGGNGGGSGSTREALLAGATVYIDANNNGVRDIGERASITNNAGQFTFNGLLAGSYTLRPEVDLVNVVTLPTSGFFEVDLGDQEDFTGVTFGLSNATNS